MDRYSWWLAGQQTLGFRQSSQKQNYTESGHKNQHNLCQSKFPILLIQPEYYTDFGGKKVKITFQNDENPQFLHKIEYENAQIAPKCRKNEVSV